MQEYLPEPQAEVKRLRAMLKAVMTPGAIDNVAETIRQLKLMRELGGDISLANARLTGRISNGEAGDRRVLYPALYHKPGTKHRYMVSGNRVVGQSGLTAVDISQQGYKFERLIR